MIAKRKTTTKQTWRLAVLLLIAFTWTAGSGNNESGNAASESRATRAIRIVDQYGRQVPSGKRDVGSEIFDVIVGPLGNEYSFVPDTVNISVGDTVRWTWESNFHSVTSGKSCFADGQFCSPDNICTAKPAALTTKGSCMSLLLPSRACTSISAPCTALLK
jgi:plastocyanin